MPKTTWRTPTSPPPGPSHRRLYTLAGTVTAFGAAAAATVWVILWLMPPPPACLVVAFAGYEDNLAVAPNAEGREAGRRFAALAGSSAPLASWFGPAGRLRLAGSHELRRGVDWARGLDRAPERAAIVYLGLHGGADADGPYLLPHDASADPADRLRLRAVLDRLAELPAGMDKLLLLDATGNGPDLTAGRLSNDFARALEAMADRVAAVPNLLVVSASGPGERSWPAADGRISLFGQHVLAGLSRGGRMTSREFIARLRDDVARDAAHLHRARQTVAAYPSDGSRTMSLTFRVVPPPPDGERPSSLPTIQEAWAEYHGLGPKLIAARATSPGALRLWQGWLVRHEALRLAGSAEADMALARAKEMAQKVRAQTDPGLISPADTLAGPALIGDGTQAPDPFPALEELWNARPADRAKVWERLKPTTARRHLQETLIARAAENPSRNLAPAVALLRVIDDPYRATRPAEAHFAVMLARDLPEGWDEDLVRAALRLRVEAERTAFCVAPGYAYAERVAPRIAAAVEQADEARQRGQDLLLATAVNDLVRANEALTLAARRYREAGAEAQAVRAALEALHRGWDELPAHAVWMPAAGAARFDELRRLERLLSGPAKREELVKSAASLQAALDRLASDLDRFATTCEGYEVLTVPSLAPQRRWRLIERRERLARRERSMVERGNIREPVDDAPRQLAIGRAMAGADGDIGELLRATATEVEAAKSLDDAERLSRRLDAGQQQPRTFDPADRARREALARLLVWQSERTRRDGWHGEDGSPYYRAVGRDYLRDAETLSPAPVAGARKRLETPLTLTFDAPTETRLLAGETRTLTAALRGATGRPVVWADPGEGLTLARGPARSVQHPVEPEPARVGVASPDLDRAEQTPPADATPRRTSLVWRGLYRGKRVESPATVWLHPVAESTRAEGPAPRGGAVAVRASPDLLARYGSADGALAVVLDCSGSTGPPAGEAMTDVTRYRQLVRALRHVLGKVPRGTLVSVWTFGQYVGPRTTPEQTVTRAQDPVRWTGEETQLDQVIDRVDGLRPWNESPVVRTMLRAKEDLTRSRGARTLLVLTDGMDNRIATDAESNPDKLPATELLTAAFKGTGIAVHVVGFQVVEGEEAEARKQFEPLAKFDPPGSFTTVSRIDDVARSLGRVLKPDLRYRLVAGEYRSEVVGIAANGESDRWLTPPDEGDYRFQATAWPVSQRLSLGSGAGLLLELAGGGERPALRRLMWTKDGDRRLAPARQRRDWRAAVLQSQGLEGGRLQMLAALEKNPDPDEATVIQPTPRAVWMELTAPAGSPPVRWGAASGYPAPCYGLDAAGWPAASRPRLRLWWSPDMEASYRTLRRPADFRTLAEVPRPMRLIGDRITIDSAAVERRWAGGGRRWCVVLRITHPPGEPVQAALEGMPEPAGVEHRWHTSAGRYAGVFWYAGLETRGQLEDAVDRSLAGVRLTSLGVLRREAEARGYAADFDDLDAPASSPARPRPVFAPR